MAVAAVGHGGRMRRLIGRDPIGYLFIAPYVIFLAGLFAYPLLVALYISFFDFFFAAPGAHVARPFVGLDNYARALSDPVFQRSILNVAEFIIINVPLTVLLSLVLAAALNSKLPFRTFFRVAYYIPYVTASVAVIGVWLWLFSGGGLLNGVLGPLSPKPSWLVNELWAMPVIALVVTWKQLGFYVLLYLAALLLTYREGIEQGHAGYAAAIGTVLGSARAGLVRLRSGAGGRPTVPEPPRSTSRRPHR